MTQRGRVARALVAVVSFSLGTAACSTAGTTTCDCIDPAIAIRIPADIAASVTSVALSGNACAGVTPACTNQTGGCTEYRFEAKAAGACHVDVTTANGVFAADVTIIQTTGCCAGLFASPESAAAIDVPGSDGGAG